MIREIASIKVEAIVEVGRCELRRGLLEGKCYLAQIWGTVDTIEKDILAGFTKTEQDRFLADLKRIHPRCLAMVGNGREETS